LGLIIVDPNNSLLVVGFFRILTKSKLFLKKEKVAIGLVPLPPPIFAK
jgi:hypothetical protein